AVARRGAAGAELDDTYALFYGGRAVSENLQLSRDLPVVRSTPVDDDTPVPVAGVDGITVAAMDWTAALNGESPELDALATSIPADQHAVFFPNLAALLTLAERTT